MTTVQEAANARYRKSGSSDPIAEDFESALKRLLDARPKNPVLLKAAKRGLLKINATTVAKEAGHSRTLIGHDNCKYLAIRAKILGLRKTEGAPTRLQDIVSRRRAEAAKLRLELKVAISHNGTLFAEVLRLRKEVGELRKELGRRSKPVVVSLPINPQ